MRLKLFVPVLALGFAAEIPLWSQPLRWDPANNGNGHYYQIVPLSGTWTDSNDFANGLTFKGMPGHLVTITSDAEREFLESNLLPGEEPISVNYWIGLTDRGSEGMFQWVTGEPFFYDNWTEGEPNDFGSGEDFAAIRWEVTCDDGCVGVGMWNDLADAGEQGFERLGPFPIIEYEPVATPLYFAQFGDGSGLFSKIVLSAQDPDGPTSITMTLKDDDGRPLMVDLNGENVPGRLEASIPGGGTASFQSDGLGPLRVGSVTVESDRPIAGVVLFAGTVGLAGVGSSALLERGFNAPMESDRASGIDTGVAVMNLEAVQTTLNLQLCDSSGATLATAELNIAMMGHLARFITQFDWDPAVDFSDFEGTLKVSSSGRIAATVIQTRPGQFATLPVIPR